MCAHSGGSGGQYVSRDGRCTGFYRGRGHELLQAALYLGLGIRPPVAGVQLDGNAAVGQARIGTNVENSEIFCGLSQLHVNHAAVDFVVKATEQELGKLAAMFFNPRCTFFRYNIQLMAYPDSRYQRSLDFEQVEMERSTQIVSCATTVDLLKSLARKSEENKLIIDLIENNE